MENPEKHIQDAEHPALFDMTTFDSTNHESAIPRDHSMATPETPGPATIASPSTPTIKIENRTRLPGSEDREWEQNLMEDAEDRKRDWHA